MLKSINRNHGKRVYLTGVLCLILSFYLPITYSLEASLDATNRLPLYSIAIYRESRNDIYIAALFAPSSASSYQQLYQDKLAKRMSFKFLSKYSTRQMSRLIKQRITLNNPKQSWQPFTQQIVSIANLFKRSMQSGDQIDIDFIPSQGLKVYLNKSLFLTIKQREVYHLLLNIWLGNIVPTGGFKASIRGQQTEDDKRRLASQYQSIDMQLGRFDQDKEKPKVAKVVRKPKPAPRKIKKLLPKLVKTVVKAKVAIPKPKLPSKNPASKPAGQKQSVAQTQSLETKMPIDIPVSIVKPAVDKDLLSVSYTQSLIDHIREYQYYPSKALVAEEQGRVIVKITINQLGKIESRKLIERSGSRILDREVLKMVSKAAPFPKIPDDLERSLFVFEVPLEFTLSD